jgi:STE24 endopeptidase
MTDQSVELDKEMVALDEERQAKARIYARIGRVVSLVDLVTSGVFLALLVFTSAAVALVRLLATALGSQLLVVAGFVLLLVLAATAVTLPLTVLGGWTLPRRFGLSTQTLGQWAADWLKGVGISLVLAIAIVEVLYWLLAAEPTWWWLIAGGLYVVFVVVLANLAPVVLVPIFFRLTPLPASPLTERLEALARTVGVKVRGVFRMNLSAKTTAANAALMGIGNTRRVILGDTLLDQFTDDEIAVVFAHELGHQAHRDIFRLIGVQSVLTVVSLFVCNVALVRAIAPLGYAGLADVGNLPLLALGIGIISALTGPLGNAISRRFERAADEFALRTTGASAAFVDAMTRLANQNLAEYDPDRWIELIFYDHPSIRRRIQVARSLTSRAG